MKSLLTLFAICALSGGHALAAEAKPNVLFIAVDDLNDWIGCLGGHPQTLTPNLDRLAASGVLFRNADCAAAPCNPSRTAVLSSLPPHRGRPTAPALPPAAFRASTLPRSRASFPAAP